MGLYAFKTLNQQGKALNWGLILYKAMKKYLLLLGLFCLLSLGTASLSSCTPKVGCELNEGLAPKTNRKGELSKKRGKSNLFDKKKRKKMGY